MSVQQVQQENRREQRIALERPLKVVMGSVGTEIRYNLLTKDVSTSGFFLAFEKPGRFPFTHESIMEVWMELDSGRAIFFNGKMARIVFPGDKEAVVTGPGIAVRIVQIDRQNDQLLKEFIAARADSFASSGSHEVA